MPGNEYSLDSSSLSLEKKGFLARISAEKVFYVGLSERVLFRNRIGSPFNFLDMGDHDFILKYFRHIPPFLT